VPDTLLISDLHLGARAKGGVLEQPLPLQRLLEAVGRHDRLVLLGDALELVEAKRERVIAVAEPIFRALGAALGAGHTVLLVPGNHDHELVRTWALAQGESLTPDSLVPVDSSPLLERIAGWLAPARVEVRYPGVWLSDTVWATHGHYLGHFLFPVSTWGLLRGRGPQPAGVPPCDHERFLRGGWEQMGRMMRWLPGPVATGLEDLSELLRAETMPQLQRRIMHHRLAPLTAHALGIQMRHHSLPAIARVVRGLGIEPEFVVFGHVHRLGPLPGDDPAQWRVARGAGVTGAAQGASVTNFLNTGSWRYERLLLEGVRPPHPYWPGGAVSLKDGEPPRAVGLLDDLTPDELQPLNVSPR
jgi:hypothetical protein